jgi:NAD(P)-dependent dehydrogenase (short-subunit alcohol dehydrogenase family)
VRALAQVTHEHDRLDAINNAKSAARSRATGGWKPRRLRLRFAMNHLAATCSPVSCCRCSGLRTRPHRQRRLRGQAPIDFDDVMLERSYDGWRAYAQSKLAQIMFTFDLADELRDRGVTANCLHPATYMPTKMVIESGIDPTSSLEDGMRATLRLVADPELDGVTGRYFNGQRPAEPLGQARDPEARRQLRELSDRLVHSALI